VFNGQQYERKQQQANQAISSSRFANAIMKFGAFVNDFSFVLVSVAEMKHENCNESYHQYQKRTLGEMLMHQLTNYNWPTVIIQILIDYAILPFGIFTFGGCKRRFDPPSEQATFIKPSLDGTGDIEIEQLPSMPSPCCCCSN
jgi:hypothetical protein